MILYSVRPVSSTLMRTESGLCPGDRSSDDETPRRGLPDALLGRRELERPSRSIRTPRWHHPACHVHRRVRRCRWLSYVLPRVLTGFRLLHTIKNCSFLPALDPRDGLDPTHPSRLQPRICLIPSGGSRERRRKSAGVDHLNSNPPPLTRAPCPVTRACAYASATPTALAAKPIIFYFLMCGKKVHSIYWGSKLAALEADYPITDWYSSV